VAILEGWMTMKKTRPCTIQLTPEVKAAERDPKLLPGWLITKKYIIDYLLTYTFLTKVFNSKLTKKEEFEQKSKD
jgi:hypothetical protein